MTERAEVTSNGPRHTDLDGMSQISFQTGSHFGAGLKAAPSEEGSQAAHSTYTKPFTVQN